MLYILWLFALILNTENKLRSMLSMWLFEIFLSDIFISIHCT